MKKIKLNITSVAAFLFVILNISPFELGAQNPASNNGESNGNSHHMSYYFSDFTLINQNGETVHLSSLVKDKVVCINFIFTTCTTICPPIGANFVRLKNLMADKIDNDLVMISISIDPVTDTPERLKAWSDKFNPGANWTLLTGDKNKIDQILKNLEVFTPLIEDHAPIILMGSDGKENWIHTNALADPSKLAELLNRFWD